MEGSQAEPATAGPWRVTGPGQCLVALPLSSVLFGIVAVGKTRTRDLAFLPGWCRMVQLFRPFQWPLGRWGVGGPRAASWRCSAALSFPLLSLGFCFSLGRFVFVCAIVVRRFALQD